MVSTEYGEKLPFQYRYETDARFTHRLALAITRLTLTRSVFGAALLAFAAIGLMGLVGTVVGLFLSLTTGVWHDIVPLVFALVLGVLVIGLMLLGGYYSARSALDRQFPIGSVFQSGLGESALVLGMPGSSGEIDYRNYRAVIRVGEFVYLPSRIGMRRTVLPAQLFPGAAFDELRAKIEHARTLS